MIIRVKIEDNLCTISPNTMLNNDEILFYPYIRNLLFNELYSNGELKDSFPKWFKSKRELNEDKTKKGYLSEKCRVKAIKLRGIISDGMLMPISTLDVLGVKSNLLSVGDEFTDINDVSVCEKYVIPQNQSRTSKNNVGK